MRVVVDGVPRDVKTVWYEDGLVRLIDQRALPAAFRLFDVKDAEDAAFAIEDMVVRGAPAIGATAAYAMAQAAAQGRDLSVVADRLRGTRPTAHDLFHAIDTILGAAREGKDALVAARAYASHLEEECRSIGKHGEALIADGARLMTHCNAGALATVDMGTALAPMRVAHGKGRSFFVYVNETRPRLQGARLTAWELRQEGIDHAVIADSAAGHYLRRGEVNLVLVGADRIAANGDFANKIGTYPLAVVAREHDVPFYVAAPASTFDFTLPTGDKIPIEERSWTEVLRVGAENLAPAGTVAFNPAFDVTPAKLVRGYVTERGILSPGEFSRLRRA